MKELNPFIIKGYVSKDLFCNRETELKILENNFNNNIDFLSKYGIGTPANARRLSKALIDKDLLLSESAVDSVYYQVYDVFFMRWF